MRADEAAKKLLRSDLGIMKINEPYIAEDIDTEFLHDYRVALRRSRVLLAQMRGVFPEAQTVQFKADLRRINQHTNQLRDLDVYLLAEADYRALLPENMQEDIAPLFDFLKRKRAAALKATVAGLKSDKYRQIMQAWTAFLDEPINKKSEAPNAKRPVKEMACERIFKRYRRILRDGKMILVSEDDEQMHDLRLECKKLRYLMEFFATLFPPDEISVLIKQLKKLQTNLGDFNDLCVQESYLLNIANEMSGQKGQPRSALLAVGALVAKLHEERLRVKAEFADTFKAFSTTKNRNQFRLLFKTEKGKK